MALNDYISVRRLQQFFDDLKIWLSNEYSVKLLPDTKNIADTVNVGNNRITTISEAYHTFTINVTVAEGECANTIIELNTSIVVNNSTVNVTVNNTAISRDVSVDGSIQSNKKYQIVCRGTCWTMFEVGSGAAPGPDYNPLDLPPYTIRVRYQDGVDPATDYSKWGVRYEQVVGATGNVWDVTKYADPEHPQIQVDDWSWLFSDTEGQYIQPIIEVLGANTTGVTDMGGMFAYCTTLTTVSLFDTSTVIDMASMFDGTSITTVPLFDTSSCTNMNGTFAECANLTTVPLLDTHNVENMRDMFSCFQTGNNQLTTIPLFDTSSCIYMDRMFQYCRNVQSGALALYQQVSSQGTVPTHNDAFEDCGADTQTGLAELNQIPLDWGGNLE